MRQAQPLWLFPFQSTLPRGSDKAHIFGLTTGTYFNPRSLAGATDSLSAITARIGISIHAPSRERPGIDFKQCSRCNFNPRSLAGATSIPAFRIALSIHFNPRSLAGATALVIRQSPELHHFNPRSLAGATRYGSCYAITTNISIHAPSRERQSCSFCTLVFASYFNPRSLAGATEKNALYNYYEKFQSTLPRGSDFYFFFCTLYCFNFNPRSLAGATEPFRAYNLIYNISIHAPSRERHMHCLRGPTKPIFQSTLPRGSDRTFPCLQSDLQYFNPRSLAGATYALFARANKTYISIHAPSRERPAVLDFTIPQGAFQSTLPRGSDCFQF